jgi:hypothetical protein
MDGGPVAAKTDSYADIALEAGLRSFSYVASIALQSYALNIRHWTKRPNRKASEQAGCFPIMERIKQSSNGGGKEYVRVDAEFFAQIELLVGKDQVAIGMTADTIVWNSNDKIQGTTGQQGRKDTGEGEDGLPSNLAEKKFEVEVEGEDGCITKIENLALSPCQFQHHFSELISNLPNNDRHAWVSTTINMSPALMSMFLPHGVSSQVTNFHDANLNTTLLAPNTATTAPVNQRLMVGGHRIWEGTNENDTTASGVRLTYFYHKNAPCTNKWTRTIFSLYPV